MQTGKKKVINLVITLFILFLLLFFLFVIYVMDAIYHPPGPKTGLSRIESQSLKTAQEIIDNYAEELKAVAAAAELMGPDEEYHYCLNFTAEYAGADSYEEQLREMPQELADALGKMEQEFPEFIEFLWLRKGQVGVSVTNGSLGDSYLCYPGENLIMGPWVWPDGTETMRRRDMGDGWELQMYYAPKG